MKILFTLISLSFALASHSQAAVLKCDGLGDDKGQSVQLEILSEKQVKVDGDLADLDEAFNPRLNTDLLRYEYESNEEGINEVLVQAGLLEGNTKGIIKVQNRGESFETSSYYCHP